MCQKCVIGDIFQVGRDDSYLNFTAVTELITYLYQSSKSLMLPLSASVNNYQILPPAWLCESGLVILTSICVDLVGLRPSG